MTGSAAVFFFFLVCLSLFLPPFVLTLHTTANTLPVLLKSSLSFYTLLLLSFLDSLSYFFFPFPINREHPVSPVTTGADRFNRIVSRHCIKFNHVTSHVRNHRGNPHGKKGGDFGRRNSWLFLFASLKHICTRKHSSTATCTHSDVHARSQPRTHLQRGWLADSSSELWPLCWLCSCCNSPAHDLPSACTCPPTTHTHTYNFSFQGLSAMRSPAL